jgi:hypothetical protein
MANDTDALTRDSLRAILFVLCSDYPSCGDSTSRSVGSGSHEYDVGAMGLVDLYETSCQELFQRWAVAEATNENIFVDVDVVAERVCDL